MPPNLLILLQLFHGGCPDGFAAAYAAYLTLGDKAKYIGIGHGKGKEEAAGDLNGKSVTFNSPTQRFFYCQKP